MSVSLGRSIHHPTYFLCQIVHSVSIFFLALGFSRIILGVAEVTLGVSNTAYTGAISSTSIPQSTSLPNATDLIHVAEELFGDNATTSTVSQFPRSSVKSHPPFQVPLVSLFDSPVSVYVDSCTDAGAFLFVDGSHTRFYFQHLIAAIFSAYPLSLMLQRRKYVLDFVLTIFIVYLFFTDFMLHRFLGGGIHWWLASLSGLTVLFGCTYFICKRRELAEIIFGGSGAAAGGGYRVSPTAAVAVGVIRDAGEEEMTEVYIESLSQPGVPLTEGGGRGRAGGGVGANTTMATMSSVSDSAWKHKAV